MCMPPIAYHKGRYLKLLVEPRTGQEDEIGDYVNRLSATIQVKEQLIDFRNYDKPLEKPKWINLERIKLARDKTQSSSVLFRVDVFQD